MKQRATTLSDTMHLELGKSILETLGNWQGVKILSNIQKNHGQTLGIILHTYTPIRINPILNNPS